MEIVLVLYIIILFLIYLYYTSAPNPAFKVNSNDLALESFLECLANCHEDLKIFDDGGNNSKWFYNNNDLIRALRSKLETKNFKLSIHFNEIKDLEINRLTKDFPEQVELKYKPKDLVRPKVQYHFKLFDNGKICYTSFHELDSTERKYAINFNKWYYKEPINITNARSTFAEQEVIFKPQ